MELTTINDVPFYCSCSKPNRNPREGNFSVETLSTLDCCGMIWYSIASDARTYVSSRRLLSHHAQNSHIFSRSCKAVNGFLFIVSIGVDGKIASNSGLFTSNIVIISL